MLATDPGLEIRPAQSEEWEITTSSNDGFGIGYKGVQYTEHGLKLPENLPFNVWLKIGDMLKKIEMSIQWALGDWLIYGETRYGEMYTQALESTDYKYDTLRAMVYVANKFRDPQSRNEHLTWSHHKAVAPIIKEYPEIGQELMEQAVENNWSVPKLKEQVREQRLKIDHKSREEVAEQTQSALFNLIVAYPPWKPDFEHIETAEVDHKVGMSISDIMDLKIGETHVSEYFSDDALLFLVTPNIRIKDGYDILEAWGFEFKTTFVLPFTRPSTNDRGFISNRDNLLLLMGERGDSPTPILENRESSVISIPNSHELGALYRVIDHMFPTQNGKLRMFEQGELPNWTTWK